MNNTQFETLINKKFDGFSAEVTGDLWREIKGSLKSKAKKEDRQKPTSNLHINSMLSYKVKYAIQILAEIGKANQKSRTPRVADLKRTGGFDAKWLRVVMHELRKKRWVSHCEYHYTIAIDLSQKTLYDLMIAMNEELRMGGYSPEEWPTKNRSKYDRVITLDRQLTAEFEQRLKEFTLSEIIQDNSTATATVQRKLIQEPNKIKLRA